MRAGLALALGLAVVGCSKEDGRPPVFPVEGQVTFKGKPASGAFVVFHPLDATAAGEEKPMALVLPDGSFKLTSQGAASESVGAPVGRYAVTVEWRKLVGQGSDVTPGPNVIPLTYSKPETTPIKVAVEAKENHLEPIAVK
jgi:hypothetical protein